MKLTGRLVVSCCRDMLRRRTSLVANGAKRTRKWLPRAIVVARMTQTEWPEPLDRLVGVRLTAQEGIVLSI